MEVSVTRSTLYESLSIILLFVLYSITYTVHHCNHALMVTTSDLRGKCEVRLGQTWSPCWWAPDITQEFCNGPPQLTWLHWTARCRYGCMVKRQPRGKWREPAVMGSASHPELLIKWLAKMDISSALKHPLFHHHYPSKSVFGEATLLPTTCLKRVQDYQFAQFKSPLDSSPPTDAAWWWQRYKPATKSFPTFSRPSLWDYLRCLQPSKLSLPVLRGRVLLASEGWRANLHRRSAIVHCTELTQVPICTAELVFDNPLLHALHANWLCVMDVY